MRRAGFHIVAYLDDSLVIGKDFTHCRLAHQYLLCLIGRLGFAVNWEKIVSPTQRVQFLGLVIDSNLKRIELPEDKMQKLLAICSEYYSKRKVTKRELQVIVGHMTFASRAIYGARTFTRIFIDALNTLDKPHFHLRLTKLLKNELLWWTNFAKTFNGLCPCNLGARRNVVVITTDASFSGFGAVMGKQWLAGLWSHTTAPTTLPHSFTHNMIRAAALHPSLQQNINYLELAAACISARICTSPTRKQTDR